ncbi:PREDICTED: cytochrome P450 3A24-like [Branchiostoma belcheri]|uniref:Cytochrome P450 3A24-like n=1 Tax=Branchiostoma belcheri TaxID=7741 RepID=A0A6P5ASP0_BRABE|nr:PREDICTED: cytochrome P450 3A24-like [Branchiostoma belcheri]
MSSMVDLLPLSPTWVLLGVCLLLYYLQIRRVSLMSQIRYQRIFFVSRRYLTWPFNKFKKLGIPGPKPVLNFGNLLKYSEGSHVFDMECYKKYGKVCGIFEGRRPVLMIGDLGLIKEITVKQFHKFNNRMDLGSILESFAGSLFVIRDADWKRVRSAITPTLSSGKLKQMSMLVEKCADGLVSSLVEKQEKGVMFDMKENCLCLSSSQCNMFSFLRISSAYTMDVISSTAFGMDIDSLHNPDHPFVTHAKAIFDMNMLKVYAYILVPPPFNNIFTIGGLSFFPKFATDFFKNTIEKAIKTREGSMDDTERIDFLQLLLKAHNKHRDGTTDEVTGGPGLSMKEIVGNSLIFWLVGYDTTANTIALTAYNLAFNQEAQDRVMEEVDTVVQNRGKLDYEAGHELRYLEMCVNETLRIYPGAKRFDRVCREDADINGLHIPAGTNINFPVWAIHHDPELWPEPDKFRPERFSKEEVAARDPFAFLSFGAGPRGCVGMRLAMLEIKLALARALQKFRFVTCEKTEVT